MEDVGGEDPDVTVGDGEPGEVGSQAVDVSQSSPAHDHSRENTETHNVIFCENEIGLKFVRFDIFIDNFFLFHYFNLYEENLLILY